MSRANPGKSNAPMRNSRDKGTNVRIGSSRSKSIDPARLRRRQKNDMQKTHIERSTLEEYGYYFHNGKLISTEDDKPFEFNVYLNDEDNNKRYHSIGRLVDNYVYNLLETECYLRRMTIPIDARTDEPTGFFFASDDIRTADYLMIIIHGMGVVRAGQWSRKLIINESLQVGSQLNYIRQARTNGYAVIVTNTNLNTDESSESNFNRPRYIRTPVRRSKYFLRLGNTNGRKRTLLMRISTVVKGSASAEEHACYIWDTFVRQSPARHICIVAHSYGGAVMLELASRYMPEFDKRVFAVALTDSPMKAYTKCVNANVLRMLEKRTINWIAGKDPVNTDLGVREYGRLRAAGHTLHEWTSYTASYDIFQFIKEQRQKLERYS